MIKDLSDQFSNLNLTEVVMVCELQEHVFSLTPSTLSSTVKYISESIFADSDERIVQMVSNIFNAIKIRPASTSLYAHLIKELISLSSPENKLGNIRSVILDPFPSVVYPSFDRFAFLNECLKLKIITEVNILNKIRTNYEKYPHTFLPWKYSLVWFMPIILRNDSKLFQSMFLELKESVSDFKNPLPIKNVNSASTVSEQNVTINQSVQYIHKQEELPAQVHLHSRSYESVKEPAKNDFIESTESDANIDSKEPIIDNNHGNIPVMPNHKNIPNSNSNQELNKDNDKRIIDIKQPNLSTVSLNSNINRNQNNSIDLNKSNTYTILNPIMDSYPNDGEDEEFKKQFSNPVRELADFMDSINYLKNDDWSLYNTMVSNTYVPESLPAILKEDRPHDLAKFIERYNKNEKKRIRQLELKKVNTKEYEYEYEYEEEEEEEDFGEEDDRKSGKKKGKKVLAKFSDDNEEYEYETSSSYFATDSAADLSKNIETNADNNYNNNDQDAYSIRFQSNTELAEKSHMLRNSFIARKMGNESNKEEDNQNEPNLKLVNNKISKGLDQEENNEDNVVPQNEIKGTETNNSGNIQTETPSTNTIESKEDVQNANQNENEQVNNQENKEEKGENSNNQAESIFAQKIRMQGESSVINIMDSKEDAKMHPGNIIQSEPNLQQNETEKEEEVKTIQNSRKQAESTFITVPDIQGENKIIQSETTTSTTQTDAYYTTPSTSIQSDIGGRSQSSILDPKKKRKIKKLKNRDEVPKFVPFNVNQRIVSTVFEKNNFLRNGPTLVQFAAFYGSVLCVIELVKRGADVTIPDLSNKQSAMYAIAGGNMKIIEIFEYVKADFTATPQIAAFFMRDEAFKRLMSTERFKLDNVDIQYASILHQAAASNNIRTMIQCIDNGVSVNIQNHKKLTPLHFAIHNGQLDAVLLLNAHKDINVNAKSDEGVTPLMLACKNGYKAIVSVLLSNPNINVNEVDNKGSTAAHFAVLSNYIDIIMLLIEHQGIDLSIKDENHRTAADLANLGGFHECAKIISEHMKSGCIIA